MPFVDSYESAAAGWPSGTAARSVTTSWGATHLLTAGQQDAQTVLLLHGDGATATSWAGVAAALSDRFRVVAPDQPGNPGRSTSSRTFAGTADMTAWVGEVLDEVTPGSLHLAGHSSGAHLALSCALARTGGAGRIASLTLLDPTFCFTGVRPSYLTRALPMLVRPTPERVLRFLSWETDGRVLDTAWARVFVEGATECERTLVVRTRRPRRRELAGLDVPTLVVPAGRSRAHAARRVAARASAVLRESTVVEVAHATHHTMPVLDATEIAGLLAEHATRHPALP